MKVYGLVMYDEEIEDFMEYAAVIGLYENTALADLLGRLTKKPDAADPHKTIPNKHEEKPEEKRARRRREIMARRSAVEDDHGGQGNQGS